MFNRLNRDIFAHRGASEDAFENTMNAFQEAVRQRADGIEIDVQLTKDGVPIVIHDRHLGRLAKRDRNVDDLRFPSIKKVRLGNWWHRRFYRHRIPTLEEVVHFASHQPITLNVELKETFLERPQLVQTVVDKIQPLPSVHISSFHYELLEEVKRYDSKIETAALLKKKDLTIERLSQMQKADVFHVNVNRWVAPYIERFKEIGKPVRLYNIFETEPLLHEDEPLIIGWITDTPEKVRQVMQSKEKG